MASSQIPEGKLVSYKLLENGIIELTFKDSIRAAIDEYFDFVDRIFTRQKREDPTIRILTDASQVGAPPVVYVAQRAQEFIHTHPNPPKNRMATLSPDGIVSGLMAKMIGLLELDTKHNASRYFRSRERDLAIAWLLDDK